MKKLEIRCVKDAKEPVIELLSKYDLTYSTHEEVRTEKDEGPVFIFSVVLPDEILNDLMNGASEILDMRRTDNQIIVSDVLAYISTKLDKLQEKHHTGKKENPFELVIQPLEQYLRPSSSIVILIVISITVALAGLFLNNEAIVVGSMILSPMLGPINAVTANASLGRMRKAAFAEGTLFLLVGISVFTSAILTFVLKNFATLQLTQAILIRTTVGPFDIVVAIALGVAAALGMQTKLPEALVGVAIAAALVPPLAVSGLSLALGNMHDAEESFVLAMTYLFGLKVGEILTLELKGFTPRKYWEASKARKYRIRALLVFSIILVVLLLLIIFRNLGT